MTRYELSVNLPLEGSELPPTITATDPENPAGSETRALCPSVEAALALLVARAYALEEQLDALPPSMRASIPTGLVMQLLAHGGHVAEHLADEHGLPLIPPKPGDN